MVAAVIIGMVAAIVLVVSIFWQNMPGRFGLGVLAFLTLGGSVLVPLIINEGEQNAEQAEAVREDVSALGFTVHEINTIAEKVEVEAVAGCVYSFTYVADPDGNFAVVVGSEELVRAVPVFTGDGYAFQGSKEDCPEQAFDAEQDEPAPEEE